MERYLAEQEAANPPFEERRDQQRYRFRQPVRGRLVREFISLHLGQAPPQLELRDINQQGAGFLSTEELYQGESIEFELTLAGGQKRILHADVMWCSRDVETGRYQVGTRFHSEDDRTRF